MNASCGLLRSNGDLSSEKFLEGAASLLYDFRLPSRFSTERAESERTEDSQVGSERALVASQVKISSAHVAFLCEHIRQALRSNAVDELFDEHPAPLHVPRVIANEGVVLFADISGFTAFGERLRKVHSGKAAADGLSDIINKALKVLTQICLAWGGDVVKFAGDAIICVWRLPISTTNDGNGAGSSEDGSSPSTETETPTSTFFVEYDTAEVLKRLANRAAYEMMIAVQALGEDDLDLHGGIGYAKYLDFHLGETDRIRWELICGQACVKATSMLDQSERGEVLFLDEKGAVQRITKETEWKGNDWFAQSDAEVCRREASSTALQNLMKREREVLAYIPAALHNRLGGGLLGGELMYNVSIMFVGLPDLNLAPEELGSNSLAKEKVERLNQTFLVLTKLVRAFEGEIRDLLFDDKGLVFIGVFGAHKVLLVPELCAMRAAIEITKALKGMAQIGVTCGTCFTGMCGDEERYDFVVTGDDVNKASRFMGKAAPGQIIASAAIQEATREFISYSPHQVVLTKKGVSRTFDVFIANGQLPMSSDTLLQTRAHDTEVDRAQLVGRSKELQKAKQLIKASLLGIIDATSLLVTGPSGVGKTAFIREVCSRLRKSSRNTSMVSICGFQLGVDCDYGTSASLVEALMDKTLSKLNDEELVRAVAQWAEHTDIEVLRSLFPPLLPLPGRGPEGTSPRHRLTRGLSSRRNLRAKRGRSFKHKTIGNLARQKSFKTPKIARRTSLKEPVLRLLEELVNQRIARDESQGIVIVLEDMHWVDAKSWALIESLMLNKELRGKVFFLLTAQAKHEMLAKYVAKLVASEATVHLPLSALDEIASNQLTFSLLGADAVMSDKLFKVLGTQVSDAIDPEVLSLIYTKSSGLPLHQIILVQWLVENKLIVLSHGRYRFASRVAQTKAENQVPEDLAEILIGCLNTVQGEGRRIIKLATVLGERFEFQTLLNVYVLDVSRGEEKEYDEKYVDECETLVRQWLNAFCSLNVLEQLPKKSKADFAFKSPTVQSSILSLLPNSRYNEIVEIIQMVSHEMEEAENKGGLKLVRTFSSNKTRKKHQNTRSLKIISEYRRRKSQGQEQR